MSQPSLDQIVKGAPPPNVSVPQIAGISATPMTANDRLASVKGSNTVSSSVSDPTSLLPSSPPQIYLNLLILEASLRSQYLTLRARRRQNTFVLLLLAIWIAYFGYALFLRPREDGTGVGGSVYWVVDMAEKVALMGGIVTVILFWATGQWERGVRWPRRWVGMTNRGLRVMNCKMVILKGPWWLELLSHAFYLLPYNIFFSTPESSYHFVEHKPPPASAAAINRPRRQSSIHTRPQSSHHESVVEEDIAPGGDYVKVLLLPKQFTPEFRENWELYRTEFWERENERRIELSHRVQQRHREIAKHRGGLLWWTGAWRLNPHRHNPKPHTSHHHLSDVERPGHHHQHSLSGAAVAMSRQTSLREGKRRPSVLRDPVPSTASTHSRSSSRSVTPTPDNFPTEERSRRWSNSTAGSSMSDRRRLIKKGPSSSSTTSSTNSTGGSIAGSQRTTRLTSAQTPSSSSIGSSISGSSRPTTPTGNTYVPSLSPLANSASATSTSSDGRARASPTPPLQQRPNELQERGSVEPSKMIKVERESAEPA